MEAEANKTLWDIAQSLHQYLNIDDLILFINQRVKTALDSEGVSVILHDVQRGELVFCWADSDPENVASQLTKIQLPIDQGIAGSVFASGQAEIIDSPPDDPRHLATIDSTVGFTTTSMIVAPLQNKRTIIGVIEVLNKKNGAFGPADLEFLSTLAPIIAMAIDNARMYGELEGKFHRLKADHQKKKQLIEEVRAENSLLQRQMQRRYCFDGIIGRSAPMQRVLQLCEHVIEADITVLIGGETGTGKELIARCIHFNGPRKDKPFVTQNCGGMPEDLLTSELFGHSKGAFTGAVADKKGLFEVADGGTLFLDEVGEMSPAMQTALLRVLQDGDVRPVGATRSRKVNTRLISATHRNLEQDVADGRFREDLLYRLNVFTITMPRLNERQSDIAALVKHFIGKHNQKMSSPITRISPEALKLLEGYPFPGNIRELENEIERAMALAQHSDQIDVTHLSDKVTQAGHPANKAGRIRGTLKDMVTSLEKSVLTQLIQKHNGNRTQIAKELGLSRYGLVKKIQRYQLD